MCCKPLCQSFSAIALYYLFLLMNQKIKLLLLALGFGLTSAITHAQACDPCNSETPPAECPPGPGGPGGPSGLMPEDVIVDDVSVAVTPPEAATIKVLAEAAVQSEPVAE